MAALPPPPTPRTPPRGPSQPSRRLLIWVAAGVAALLVLGGILSTAGSGDGETSPTDASSAVETPSVAPLQVTVPDLTGMTRVEAILALREANLVYTETTIPSKRPHNTVVGQNVAAGSEVEAGTVVVLRIAVPLPRLPDVVGMNRYNAANALRKAGFKPKETPRGTITTDPKTWQRVLTQQPKAGSRVRLGSVVILDVAFPPPGTFIRVEGSGSATVTWGGIGTTHQLTVTLPWEQRVTGDTSILTVLAQRSSGDGGSITCSIIVEGRVVKHATSSGPYAICSATY